MTDLPRTPWLLVDAVDLCRKVEEICQPFGCHVALTGGALYKDGERKDADILFYAIRGKEIDKTGLYKALLNIGLVMTLDFRWGTKAVYGTKAVDIFFPETPHATDGEY